MEQYVAGGVGKALMFVGDELWGTASTLSDNTFDFTITAEDIRGGKKNVLLSQYFHDSNLSITLTNALFSYKDIVLALGAKLNQGGLAIYEEQLENTSNKVTITETPVAVNGKLIGWYKLRGTADWKVGTIEGKKMTTVGLQESDICCVKYFWNDPNARSFNIRADYEPAEIHLVILQDLFPAEQVKGEVKIGDPIGTLITDIPRFKLDGSQNLAFASGSTAVTSLTGNALAVDTGLSCEESYIYGTMTEQLYNAKWQDNVIAIAVENGDMEITTSEGETLAVRVVYKDGMASQRKDNKEFTFAVVSKPVSTASGLAISAGGEVTARGAGSGTISIKLKGNESVEPAYANVTVT